VARTLGVHIEYSSGTNVVRCPELKITSMDRERSSGFIPNLTPRGVSYIPASSAICSSSGAPSSSSSAGNAGHAVSKKESGESGGGKIKN
jgi:hypothetical protein